LLPGSHRLSASSLARLSSIDVGVPDVPGQVLATEPGDVIAFDPLLHHASWGGRDRHQYADGAQYADELPVGFRPFDRTWVAEGAGDVQERRFDQRHRWMYRCHGLGVLDRFGVADAFRP
jgi:hypothetical protein